MRVAASSHAGVGPAPCPERALGFAAAKLLAVLSAPVVGGAALVAGAGGAAGATAGLLLVLGLFGLSGVALSAVPRPSPQLVVAVSLVALGVRLVAYVAALTALAGVQGLHRPSLVVATVVALVCALTYELRVAHRSPHLFWVDAAAGSARQGAR